MDKKPIPKMFRPFGAASDNVHLDWLGEFTPSAMADAFKEAAAATIEISEAAVGHPDQYFYPVAYLYRHHIELQLKLIIEMGMQLQPPPVCETSGKGHVLQSLWQDAERVINFVFPNDDKKVVRRMGKILDELHLADPDGQSFRYYQKRNGQINLTQLPRVFSLRQLQKEIDKLSSFLSGCALGTSEALCWQQERRWC